MCCCCYSVYLLFFFSAIHFRWSGFSAGILTIGVKCNQILSRQYERMLFNQGNSNSNNNSIWFFSFESQMPIEHLTYFKHFFFSLSRRTSELKIKYFCFVENLFYKMQIVMWCEPFEVRIFKSPHIQCSNDKFAILNWNWIERRNCNKTAHLQINKRNRKLEAATKTKTETNYFFFLFYLFFIIDLNNNKKDHSLNSLCGCHSCWNHLNIVSYSRQRQKINKVRINWQNEFDKFIARVFYLVDMHSKWNLWNTNTTWNRRIGEWNTNKWW